MPTRAVVERMSGARQPMSRTGRVAIPGGPRDVPDGSTDVPGGSTDVPGGSTDVPGGSTDVPGGSTDVPGGSTDVPDGSTDVPGVHPCGTEAVECRTTSGDHDRLCGCETCPPSRVQRPEGGAARGATTSKSGVMVGPRPIERATRSILL